ncbi:helix-turn-helix domain-containing protein [Streptomyces sp. OE57]|uniref:helix-turn-helix domain-containing protein n=1 Tax=Streptomyces lacaronensis TaxID=3379885 RepID=UPI0039B78F5D
MSRTGRMSGMACAGRMRRTGCTAHRSTPLPQLPLGGAPYRLQRIREIGGCDLADVDSRLNLQVATRIWKIMRSVPE